jgi:hypothetical protein
MDYYRIIKHIFDQISEVIEISYSNLLIINFGMYIEGPTIINFDILVSSFGPIQDMDMVCCLN